MPTEPQSIGNQGPFTGMSCLPWRLREGKASLAVNVDFSRGTIKSRKGYKCLNRFTATYRILGVHGFINARGREFIAVVMWDEANFRTLFNVINPDGTHILSSDLDLSLIPNAHPPNPWGYVHFIKLNGVLAFTTPHGRVHYIDVDRLDRMPRILAPGDPFARADDVGDIPMYESLPRCSVVHNFGSVTVYAGFSGDESIPFSVTLPDIQTDLPPDDLNDNRDAMLLRQNALVYSDPDCPTNIPAMNIKWIASGERITGMASLHSKMLVFTESSTYVATLSVGGASGVNMDIQPLVEGIGCVGPRAIAQGRGIVVWMGPDGFYSWDGNQVRSIGDDMADMFEVGGWAPGPMYDIPISRIPYPFRAASAQFGQVNVEWNNKEQSFWFSVPVVGGTTQDMEVAQRVVCVYWPHMDAWSMYMGGNESTFNPASMTSYFSNHEHMFVFGDDWGGIHLYGEGGTDRQDDATRSSAGTAVAITWLWQSGPLELGPNTTGKVRSLRTRQKAQGAGSGTDADGGALTLASQSWHIDTDRAFDQIVELDADGNALADNQDLSFSGDLHTSPNQAPPLSKQTGHYWNTTRAVWEKFRWHVPETWRVRYSVDSNIVGQSFRVGFSDTSALGMSRKPEIHAFDLEVQPKRDIT